MNQGLKPHDLAPKRVAKHTITMFGVNLECIEKFPVADPATRGRGARSMKYVAAEGHDPLGRLDPLLIPLFSFFSYAFISLINILV